MLHCFSNLTNYNNVSVIASNSIAITSTHFSNTSIFPRFEDQTLEKGLKKCVLKHGLGSVITGKKTWVYIYQLVKHIYYSNTFHRLMYQFFTITRTRSRHHRQHFYPRCGFRESQILNKLHNHWRRCNFYRRKL